VTIDPSGLTNLQPSRHEANAARIDSEQKPLAGAQLQLPTHDRREHEASAIAEPKRDGGRLVVLGSNVGHRPTVPHIYDIPRGPGLLAYGPSVGRWLDSPKVDRLEAVHAQEERDLAGVIALVADQADQHGRSRVGLETIILHARECLLEHRG